MIKNLSKVILTGFLVVSATGGVAANALEVYNKDNNKLDLSAEFQAYFTHDQYGAKTGATAEVEALTTFDVKTNYTRVINQDLSFNGFLHLVYNPTGYMNGPWGWAAPEVLGDTLNDRLYVSEGYIGVNSKKYGNFQVGLVEHTPYYNVKGYSDVDIFIGAPANDMLMSSAFLGGKHTDGISYNKTFLNNKLTLDLFAQGGHQDTAHTMSASGYSGVNLYRKDGYGLGVQYKITDNVSVGYAGHLTQYKIRNENAPHTKNFDNSQFYGISVLGVQYAKGGTSLGLTLSGQSYDVNNLVNTKTTVQKAGLEIGGQYDFSGKQVGFRPSIQFDYAKEVSKNTVGGVKQADVKVTPTMATEIGLSYYVTPNLAYMAAAIVDLRSSKQIKKADPSNTDGDSNNYFGVGILYNVK